MRRLRVSDVMAMRRVFCFVLENAARRVAHCCALRNGKLYRASIGHMVFQVRARVSTR